MSNIIAGREAELALLNTRVAALAQGRHVLAVGEPGALALPAHPDPGVTPDCVVVAFQWSRVARDEQDAFLADLRARSGPGALLVLVDDAYVEGVSPPVARTDLQGNTYQRVTGADGVQVELPKNYPSDSALRKRLAGAVRDIRIERFTHFWLLTCRLK